MSFGLIGLGKMGANLALNISKKHDLSIYNRSYQKTAHVLTREGTTRLKGFETIEDFVDSMEAPRTIITMLPNNVKFDIILDKLDPGDTLIDCANELYGVSHLKNQECREHEVHYLGVGMSGGAQGALEGPAIMIGGSTEIYYKHKEFLESFSKNSVFISDDSGSGHFTKMVHNGIEYSMLQVIADVYSYVNKDKDMFELLIRTCPDEVKGYLTKSTLKVLGTYDIDNISDKCDMNSTGLWCSQYALDNSIPLPTMTSSVQQRIWSSSKKRGEYKSYNRRVNIILAKSVLCFVYAMAFHEGLTLVEHQELELERVQQAWSKATIIECPMTKLSKVELGAIMNDNVRNVRKFCIESIASGTSVPVVLNALAYYDFVIQKDSQMSLIMAQRNYFGQHPFIQKT